MNEDAAFYPYPPVASSLVRPQDGWEDGPATLAILGVVLCLLMSDNLLVSVGIPYDVPLGPFVAKLHPGTYAILCSFLWTLLRRNPLSVLAESAHRRPAFALFFATVLAMLIYSVANFGPSGAAFLIDTLLVPAMLAQVLERSHPRHRRMLFRVVIGLISINAVIAIVEALLQQRLVPYMAGGELLVEKYFRSTALGGHPLSNALRTSVALCTLLVLGARPLTFVLMGLFGVALLAFGSRTAIVATGLLLGTWAFRQMLSDLTRMRQYYRRVAFGLVGLVGGLGLLGVVLASTNLGERLFATFFWDDSAQSRVLAINVLGMLETADLMLGMGPQRIEQLLYFLRRTTELNDIENFWILFVLQFGVLLTSAFAVALLAFLRAMVRDQPLPVWLAVGQFFILISSNNSLATKSQNMTILVSLAFGAAAWTAMEQREQRRQRWRDRL